MLLFVAGHRVDTFRCNREYGCARRNEFVVVVAQLREMPAAERSGEAAQEHEHYRT